MKPLRPIDQFELKEVAVTIPWREYTKREKYFALRFHYTMTELGYYDIPIKALRHLDKIGLIEHQGCGQYRILPNLERLVEEETAAQLEQELLAA